jgi:hypothetical protein
MTSDLVRESQAIQKSEKVGVLYLTQEIKKARAKLIDLAWVTKIALKTERAKEKLVTLA